MPFTDLRTAVAGRAVAYVDEGPRGALPVVLLHGGGFDHAEMTWKPTIFGLRDRVRMIAPDLPGYGASDDPAAAMDLAELGRWTVGFLDAIGVDQADVAGVSMGGGIALWLAIHAADRVRRVVPVGAYGIAGRVPFHPAARLLAGSGSSAAIYRIAGHSRRLARWGLAQTYADASRVTEAAVDDLMAVARDQGRRRTFDGFLARELQAGRIATDLTPDLPRITAPTMVVHGLADRLIPPRHARAAAARIPGARLDLLPAGHWPMRERPDLFLPLLEAFVTSPG